MAPSVAPSVNIELTKHSKPNKVLPVYGVPLMGKSQKISRGYSSAFVPDYNHAIETFDKSEGFAVRGVDTKIDSSAPKMKFISLDMDVYDQFGIPVQVLSLSKMSPSDRKILELRLKNELDQVRELQKKIESMSSSVVVSSPTRDIYCYSDAQRMPISQALHKSASQEMNWALPPGENGSHTKQPTKFDLANQSSLQITSHAMLMKKCQTLLKSLMSHQHAWVFNTPVDVMKLKIPDYYNVIKYPMDLGTVKLKLTSGDYTSPLEFAADIRLSFSNAMTYNPPGNDVHIMADMLCKFFEMRWKPIEKKLLVTPVVVPIPSKGTESTIHTKIENTNPMSRTKKNIMSVENKVVMQEPGTCVMSIADKQKIGVELEALLADLPESIIDFLKEKSSNGNQTSEDEIEIEIDIDTLGDNNLFTLRKLLDNFMMDKNKNETKGETYSIELHNGSRFSNSSMYQGYDPVEEDIDIGGNDPPISSFQPVEIEKDMGVRNGKCRSSSSSSSESGTSSSDSGNSSVNEPDNVSAPTNTVPTNTAKIDAQSSGENNLEMKKIEIGDTRIKNDSVTELDEVELHSRFKPISVSVETEALLEGESAQPERQISPEKLYRAALLRSRFADTILKAQERTLGKGEIQDPERLKIEKEELERRRREEKARLQGEAKAAEEARRKAEADAAAESQRKRELEREAARQALQKMEKTVDINGNSQFFEDLEMLRVAPGEQLESFVDEKTSPEHSLDGLGSFKFQGNTNPLEQFGLYMKADDDEEGEPGSVAPVVDDDAEDGEID